MGSRIAQHFAVKAHGVPSFLGARIPVASQLNVNEWKRELEGYLDQQLLQLIRFGFTLSFNRKCKLLSDNKNHSSAIEYPDDIQTYLDEEKHYGTILGPFDSSPIPNMHFSPFMTREKPNAPNRRVIIDLCPKILQ